MGVTIVAAAIPWAWRRRHHLRPSGSPDARTIGLAILALVGIAAAIVLVAPRLTAVTSLIYRASLWRDTLAAWSTDPLLGIGPGYMPYARQAAAPDFTFPVRQPHSHNLPLGVLGDAGLLGLAAAIVLVACDRLVRGAVAVEDDDRARGGLPADRARGRRALRGPDLRAGLQPAGDCPPRGRADRRRRRRMAAVAPAGDARPGGRRRARAPGRDGRRRCRSDRVPRGERRRRQWRLGGRSLAARAIGRDRSVAPGRAEVTGGRRRARRPRRPRAGRGRVRRRARAQPRRRTIVGQPRHPLRGGGRRRLPGARDRASGRHGRLRRGRAPQRGHQLRGARDDR